MRLGKFGVAVSALSLAAAIAAPGAEAKSRPPAASAVRANVHAMKAGMMRNVGRIYAGRGGISCVPFARENSGIELSGNAGQWWSNAEGLYLRGAKPEVGSVLNFRANGRMRLGHVAVVTNVIDSRNVEIDHANWSGPGAGRGGITRDVNVVDVSERNDWTAVRVALGRSADFGSVYPTFGFIYDRPDRGSMIANNGVAPMPAMNAAPRDLRPAAERFGGEVEEVAEASDDIQPRFRRAGARHHYQLGARSMTVRASAVKVGPSKAGMSKPGIVKVRASAPVMQKRGHTHRM